MGAIESGVYGTVVVGCCRAVHENQHGAHVSHSPLPQQKSSTIVVLPIFSEAPYSRSSVAHPTTDFSKNQIASRWRIPWPKYTTTSFFETRLASRRFRVMCYLYRRTRQQYCPVLCTQTGATIGVKVALFSEKHLWPTRLLVWELPNIDRRPRFRWDPEITHDPNDYNFGIRSHTVYNQHERLLNNTRYG